MLFHIGSVWGDIWLHSAVKPVKSGFSEKMIERFLKCYQLYPII